MAENAKTGRPLIYIDKNQFEKLCALQCTKKEIASYFGCSEDTLERWCKREYGMIFKDIYAEKREGGKISLRRNMFRLAEKNAAVSIFLAKNFLGMSDRQEIAVSHDDASSQEMDAFFARKMAEKNDTPGSVAKIEQTEKNDIPNDPATEGAK